MLKHGGQLELAVKKYGIAREHWLDLSTGINPEAWPLPEIPAECFYRLPEEDDGLIQAARNYYQTNSILAVAGSQQAIQTLPRLREHSVVAVPETGYAEHAHAWRQQLHDVRYYRYTELDQLAGEVDVLILINPNNPSGESYSIEQLLEWHRQLQQRGGWLIVDEAFIDATPGLSLATYANRPGLIVLRSVGKFFGLAGVRAGFVLSHDSILKALENRLGPWSVSGVTRFVTRQALLDKAWQKEAAKELMAKASRLACLLERYSGCKVQGSQLFKTLMHREAVEIHRAFAQQGVLTRLLDNKQGVRFGLPANDQWDRFEQALKNVFEEQKLRA